jgi:hypothetical protein
MQLRDASELVFQRCQSSASCRAAVRSPVGVGGDSCYKGCRRIVRGKVARAASLFSFLFIVLIS